MRLHLGCGSKHLPFPWINADAENGEGVDRVVNFIDGMWQIEPGSVDWIYCSHAIEHVEFDTLPAMFAAWHKVMKPDGKVTIATIDIGKIFENRYRAGVRAASWNAAIYGDTWGLDRPFVSHRSCFDWDTLAEIMLAAGFYEAHEWTPEDYPEIAAIADCATTDRDVTLLLEAIA